MSVRARSLRSPPPNLPLPPPLPRPSSHRPCEARTAVGIVLEGKEAEAGYYVDGNFAYEDVNNE